MQDLFIAGGFLLIAAVGALIHHLYSTRKPPETKPKPQVANVSQEDLFRPRPTNLPIRAAPVRRFDCPFEEVDLTLAPHVDWLKSVRDAELWHVACQAALAYTDDPHGFVPWVVEQRELDRSTAGWIFLWMEGSLYLKGATKFYHSFSGDAYILDVFNRLAKRSETIGFLTDEIGLDTGFEAERQKCLDIVSSGRQSPERITPYTLIKNPYPAERTIKNIDNVEGVICF